MFRENNSDKILPTIMKFLPNMANFTLVKIDEKLPEIRKFRQLEEISLNN
jgi:hypothetical protein